MKAIVESSCVWTMVLLVAVPAGLIGGIKLLIGVLHLCDRIVGA